MKNKMPEDTKIYEDFIIGLLKNDLLVNYRVNRADARNFYNNNYKKQTSHNFDEFCGKLWYLWYIQSFKNKKIYFNKEWTIYISSLDRAQSMLKAKKIPEAKYCDDKSCQLCLVKYSGKTSFENHRKSMEHEVRMMYLQNNGKFDNLGHLKFKMPKNGSSVDTPEKLKFESNVRKTVTVNVVNTSNLIEPIEILDVVQIICYRTDIVMAANFTSKKIKNGVHFEITLKGKFENFTSFKFPIMVVYKTTKYDVNLFFLHEMEIEVKSQFSYLQPSEPYVRPQKIVIPTKNEKIIKSNVATLYPSDYVEMTILAPYYIPERLYKQLESLLLKFPNFFGKHPHGQNDPIYKRFASSLNIDPVLSEDNYCNLLDKLISIEEFQIKFDIRNYDTTSKLKLVNGSMFDLEVPGLAESRPSLILYDSVYLKENISDTRKYQGIVTKVFETSVRLRFSKKFLSIFQRNKDFFIEFGYNRRTIKVQKQAVELAKEHNITPYFYPKLGLPKPVGDLTNLDYFNVKLNEEQRRAVTNILKDRCAPYLIFGPPGTGKTVTIVESILQVLKNKPEAKLLVCASSNSATDEVATRLAHHLQERGKKQIFRLIANSYSHLIDNKLGVDVNLDKNGDFYMPSMQVLLQYRIILSTLVTASRLVNGGLPDGHYSHVFIDESGYSTETECLIPIAGVLSNNRNRGKVVGQIVLAGDPRQLGPIIQSNFVKYCGYDISMLERLIDTCEIYARNETRPVPYDENYVTKLVRNYRSHETILKIPNKLFYHNELIAEGCRESGLFTRWKHLKNPGFPVIFHHVVGEDCRERDSPSFFNIQELEHVMDYVRKLIGATVNGDRVITQEDIGIISPYRKQVCKLNSACRRLGWNKVSIGSVEQFQGKEKLIVVISTVRSKNVDQFQEIDMKCNLGFLRNSKRFNVSITRAIGLLIVVGNGDVLKTDNNWLAFIEYCVNNKSIAGAPFQVNNEDYLKDATSPEASSPSEITSPRKVSRSEDVTLEEEAILFRDLLKIRD